MFGLNVKTREPVSIDQYPNKELNGKYSLKIDPLKSKRTLLRSQKTKPIRPDMTLLPTIRLIRPYSLLTR